MHVSAHVWDRPRRITEGENIRVRALKGKLRRKRAKQGGREKGGGSAGGVTHCSQLARAERKPRPT
eukprot:6182202-Pleurochrysis_carterae.AAC.3